jgi:hypothetical protein
MSGLPDDARESRKVMLNSPRVMFERFAYTLWLLFTVASLAAALHGGVLLLLAGRAWLPFLLGAASLGFAMFLRRLGRRHLRFDACEASLDFTEWTIASREYEARAGQLRRVFDRWDAVDASRARGDGDVWQVLALRREAQTLLDADPALRTEFQHQLARHPELRGP